MLSWMELGFPFFFFLMLMYKQIKSGIIPKKEAQPFAVYVLHIKAFLNSYFRSKPSENRQKLFQ